MFVAALAIYEIGVRCFWPLDSCLMMVYVVLPVIAVSPSMLVMFVSCIS